MTLVYSNYKMVTNVLFILAIYNKILIKWCYRYLCISFNYIFLYLWKAESLSSLITNKISDKLTMSHKT